MHFLLVGISRQDGFVQTDSVMIIFKSQPRVGHPVPFLKNLLVNNVIGQQIRSKHRNSELEFNS